MEEIIIQIKDKEKVSVLTNFLKALDFVSSVRVEHKKNKKPASDSLATQADFFALAGLWKDRQINLHELRNKAWPRQPS